MESLTTVLIVAAIAVICIILVRLLAKPMKFIFKILINTGLGFVILFIVNFFGDYVGLSVGVSYLNAFIAGVFGVPGVILLILVKYFLL